MIDISKISGNQIDRSSILHSSGIGKVAHGNTFGATSSETFAARRITEANRAHVGSYSSANLHSDHRVRVRPFSGGSRADITPPRGGAAKPKPQQSTVRAFKEPANRRFNPFS